MKIVIDTLGGDYPDKVIAGAVSSLDVYKDVSIVLFGHRDMIEGVLAKHTYDASRLEIVDCTQEITNEDVPTVAFKTKTESSMVKAFDYMRADKDVIGIISAGNTGALLTGAFLKVGRIRGVSRPGMSPVLPTVKKDKQVLIIDVGANVDCKPINLCHFALMGSIYMREVYGVESPKVGLLSNGTEDKKGTDLVREANALIRKLPVDFVGNVEAREALSGNVDVLVTDGFSGNVLLKSIEGSVKFAMNALKSAIGSSFMSKIGYLFMKGSFKKLKKTLNYHNYGGSLFLGAKKIVVKSHGSSDEAAIRVCVGQVYNMYKSGMCDKVEQEISKLDLQLDAE